MKVKTIILQQIKIGNLSIKKKFFRTFIVISILGSITSGIGLIVQAEMLAKIIQ